MLYKKILLKDVDSRLKDSIATLRVFISSRNEVTTLRPGMLVCPGGGYSFCSAREAEPIAFRFLSEGFNCFVLDYTVNEKYPAPHLELAIAFNYIREHEKEFDLIPNSLSIIGFSAGGHLVGSYGFLYKELGEQLGLNEKQLRPFTITMAYPVTLMNEKTHPGTRDIITGGDKNLLLKLDIPSNIKSDYPPTFVWTTKDDDLVPYENTVELRDALEANNVRHECHIYESGWHGGSLVNRSVCEKGAIPPKMKEVRDWASLAADFIFDALDK